jgi:hypothetical protein
VVIRAGLKERLETPKSFGRASGTQWPEAKESNFGSTKTPLVELPTEERS